VHLSTAAVVGQNNDDWIDEFSICRPSTVYEKTKMQIEQVLAESMPDVELVVVRPTAVFGPGGKNLLKLARENATQSSVLRYMRACFHGRRAMNLVSVQNVAAALCHLAFERTANHRDVFIVTDDEITANNYHDVEHVLQSAFGHREYFLPVLTLPTYVQNTVLRASGKSPRNPRRRYRCDKLLHTGFAKPCEFGQALAEYASYLAGQWYSQGRITG
jgi:nucleoside-diphosphate-sugar epimerase